MPTLMTTEETIVHFTDLGDVFSDCDIERKAIESLKEAHPGRKFYAQRTGITMLRHSFIIGFMLWFTDE